MNDIKIKINNGIVTIVEKTEYDEINIISMDKKQFENIVKIFNENIKK